MKITATTADAYKLFHEGIQAFSDMERRGIRIDVKYCETQVKKLKLNKDVAINAFRHTDVHSEWRKAYGNKMNLTSNDQLAHILFKRMGFKATMYTKKSNKPCTTNEHLASVKHPAVQHVLDIKGYDHAVQKIMGIYRETVDGILHPMFNLHTAVTYRSSSEAPNFQNNDVRNEEMAELVRRCFIPRKGRVFTESDYSGIEVHGASWYHKDPNMLEYICNPEKDMHRDTSMDCYLLAMDQMTKNIRYCGKNKFVFPEFYGDYYANCATALWDAISKMNLETAQGVPLKVHLASKGIKSYERFEKHIQKVEDKFWNVRFKVYNEWKWEHYKRYLRCGFLDLLTGFRCSGLMEKNQVINYPVQGVAFHCLLRSIIHLNRWMKKQKMKSMIVGQIHDSMFQDNVESELPEIIPAMNRIMCKDLMEAWPFIITPIKIEIDKTEVDGSWFTKKSFDFSHLLKAS